LEYNLEMDSVVKRIKDEKAKTVCVQLPDGLKTQAGEIAQQLETSTDATILIWLGSCFGACDLPLEVEGLGVDLLVQWGHAEWNF